MVFIVFKGGWDDTYIVDVFNNYESAWALYDKLRKEDTANPPYSYFVEYYEVKS